MPKIVDHAMWSSLRQWALSVDGSFPQRFRLILEHAFAEYAVVLSPSQLRDVGRGEVVMGSPAKPIRQFWREVAAVSRLTKRNKGP